MAGRLHLAALAAAVVVGVACGLPSVEPPDPSSAPAPSAASSPPADGTMTEDEFVSDLRDAAGSASDYWRRRFEESGRRFTPIRQVLPYHRSGDLDCAGDAIPANNALYCSAGDFIAYDADWAVGAFRQIGDAFLYYLLGHEYAHGIQVRLGESFRFTVEQELQADCMAGAYIGDSVRSGKLSLEDGDLDELRTGLAAVGDDPDQPWFAPGAHGTAEQRTRSFFDGYQNSLAACDL